MTTHETLTAEARYRLDRRLDRLAALADDPGATTAERDAAADAWIRTSSRLRRAARAARQMT